jgi:hypothetical protein
MSTPPRKERLTQLPGRLRAEGFRPISARTCRERAQDGVIPSAEAVNFIWHYDPSRIAEIAEALGLERAPSASRQQAA